MKSYSWSYKLLHWAMAALIMVMFLALLGFNPEMSDADRTIMLVGHSSIGTIIVMLLIVRLSKRYVLKHPQPQHSLSPALKIAATLSHYALYLLMVLVPLTGYMTASFHELPVQLFGSISLNGHEDADTFATLRMTHSVLVKSLMALVAIHVAAVLMHKFVLKDNVLFSMRPWFVKK